MSDTVPFSLTDAAWTDISTTEGLSGFIQNAGTVPIIYVEAASAPDDVADSFGHDLKPGESINYVITAGAVYVRAKQGSGRVMVTGD